MKKMTYKNSGVDIDKANDLVSDYKKFSNATKIKGVMGNIGGFGALFRADFRKYKDPILVSSTDGVGTKLKIAFLADKHDTVGIDLVAMSVNDILCSGAEGLFFLDYIATGKIRTGVLRDVVKGISVGCKEAGYALVGGETAEMPGMYNEGEYDLAGFGVGIADKNEIIDGRYIRPGDVMIGLASSGLHSNGYSLVRKVLSVKELKFYSKVLLEPTRIYSPYILPLKKKIRIKGIANITGGAFYDKIPRIIPDGMAVEIHSGAWDIPEIFKIIQRRGNVDAQEMYRALNMGIGMVIVVGKADADKVQEFFRRSGLKSYVIGDMVKPSSRYDAGKSSKVFII